MFSPDGSVVLSIPVYSRPCARTLVRVLNTRTWECVHTFAPRRFAGCAFSPDGSTLVTNVSTSVLNHGTASPDLMSTTSRRRYCYHHTSPDGSRHVSTSTNGAAQLWNTTDWSHLRTLSLPLILGDDIPRVTDAIVLSPDGQFMLICGRELHALHSTSTVPVVSDI